MSIPNPAPAPAPGLGRGRRALIPADDDTDLQSPAARARAALAAVQTVPVPLVVLGGIAGLMEELERLAEAAGEDGNQQAARETLAYLRTISG
ncbi:hypothetical protein [Streptomyces telluris]|uniref:Uncharacterized protein n=1 Tax=Streptomyces telluris TaxID=2720021 RepID=A0A9X2LN42_9ACTN|nr:hypothetical protein [Streptomyces telluris]MCQ8774379.1 hypothetical protein [Streptomyces telluris]NJP82340.1 hypothetical protein [Streptomyces telluris]